MQALLLVGAGGALGAMARYWVGTLVGHAYRGPFPYATFMVNILGSLIMGLVVGYLARFTPAGQGWLRLFIAVGILGGFTTFSSFSLEAALLIERGNLGLSFVYVLSSVVAGIIALFIGLFVMRGGAA